MFLQCNSKAPYFDDKNFCRSIFGSTRKERKFTLNYVQIVNIWLKAEMQLHLTFYKRKEGYTRKMGLIFAFPQNLQ